VVFAPPSPLGVVEPSFLYSIDRWWLVDPMGSTCRRCVDVFFERDGCPCRRFAWSLTGTQISNRYRESNAAWSIS
jgi:hypothetical protein